MQFTKSLQLQKKFNDTIPGGSHTYAKGDDEYPNLCPLISKKGKDVTSGILMEMNLLNMGWD